MGKGMGSFRMWCTHQPARLLDRPREPVGATNMPISRGSVLRGYRPVVIESNFGGVMGGAGTRRCYWWGMGRWCAPLTAPLMLDMIVVYRFARESKLLRKGRSACLRGCITQRLSPKR